MPRSVSKKDLYSDVEVKTILDEYVIERLTEAVGMKEDHRVTDFRIWSDLICVVLMALAYYYPNLYYFKLEWPLPFYVVSACLLVYSFISIVSFLILGWNYKGLIFMSDQFELNSGKKLYFMIFSKMKVSSASYSLTVMVSEKIPTLLWRPSITNDNTRILTRDIKDLFTVDGILVEREVDMDLGDVIRVFSDKKSL